MVNVTDGKIIRLLVEDEPFDIRYGELRGHERVLDFRAGVLRRHAEWGRLRGGGRVPSTRLVSFTASRGRCGSVRGRAARRSIPVVVQSELVANEPLPAGEDDPRAAAALESRCVAELVGLRMTAPRRAGALDASEGLDAWRRAWTTSSTGRLEPRPRGERPRIGRVTVAADLAPGQPLRLVKFLAYGWSSQRSRARACGPGRRRARPRPATPAGTDSSPNNAPYLDEFWEHADVELEGDAEAATGGALRALPHPPSRRQEQSSERSPPRA